MQRETLNPPRGKGHRVVVVVVVFAAAAAQPPSFRESDRLRMVTTRVRGQLPRSRSASRNCVLISDRPTDGGDSARTRAVGGRPMVWSLRLSSSNSRSLRFRPVISSSPRACVSSMRGSWSGHFRAGFAYE